MNILQYDLEKYDIGTIRDVVTYLEDKGFEIVAIPKDFDAFLDDPECGVGNPAFDEFSEEINGVLLPCFCKEG